MSPGSSTCGTTSGVTAVDRDVEAEARAFHIGPEPVVVSHFLAGGREQG